MPAEQGAPAVTKLWLASNLAQSLVAGSEPENNVTFAVLPSTAVMATLLMEKLFPVPAVLKVLLVKVSVVALPTRVSVDVGKVSNPVLVMEAITGAEEKVCTPVKVCAASLRATVAEV